MQIYAYQMHKSEILPRNPIYVYLYIYFRGTIFQLDEKCFLGKLSLDTISGLA